jgi:hypothetical protein
MERQSWELNFILFRVEAALHCYNHRKVRTAKLEGRHRPAPV